MVKSYISITVVLFVINHVSQVFCRGPPVIEAPVQPRFTGKLGEFIRFICPIKGDPAPIFEWYRDGERVMGYWDRYRFGNKGYSLSIERLECEDQGTYMCKAVNGFGVHEISFQLDLLDEMKQEACKLPNSDEDDASSKPVILHKSKKSKPILKPAGNYALLKCIAVAEPLPKFHWFKDGVEIIADKGQSNGGAGPKYVIRSTVLSEEDLTEVNDMEGLRSTLQISDLRGTDTANYTCRAENEHGWDELTHVLEVVERQVPRRPELHADIPPANTLVEMGKAGSLSCKVASEFPPEVHWLKRITPTQGSTGLVQPPVPDEAEVETIHPQFIANRTIIIGNIKYQILPSAPAKLAADGFYTSILILSKQSQESDSGYYVCLALNNAGFNFRQVYFNVTPSYYTSYPTTDDYYLGNNKVEGWGDKSRADATTTAVVIVVVICGLAGMVASCFVWKRQKNNLKDKILSVPASCSSAPEAIVVQQAPQETHPPSLPDYSIFRDGLSNASSGTPPTTARFDPVHNSLMQCHPQQQQQQQQQELVQPRVYYLATRPPPVNSPRQAKIMPQQRTKLSSASGRSGSGSRPHYHRSSPRSNNHHHYHNPAHNHRQPVPPEARSLTLTTDTSFHSESFYPDWAAHPQHIRLPYPSPESSFDQL